MDYSEIIRKPIALEYQQFIDLYDEVLNAEGGLLQQVLDSVRRGRGKMLRPQLVLLLCKALNGSGAVPKDAFIGALSLELLHTASLVHDDVVDDSDKRRGMASINAAFGNKVAVLAGDYILSTALRILADTKDTALVAAISNLGKTLSHGELLQLESVSNEEISEEIYFEVISRKTASLFETCGTVAATVLEADQNAMQMASEFGRKVGLIFQIKDDILDYISDSTTIGKPVGNDLREGKVTLPLIFAVKSNPQPQMLELIKKAKAMDATSDDVRTLVDFAIRNGGIEYAEERMQQLRNEALMLIKNAVEATVADALKAYIDFAINRKK